jgi:hypothetical protein
MPGEQGWVLVRDLHTRHESAGAIRVIGQRAPACDTGGTAMDWTTPAYEEIKMDAEIGSYQQDDPTPIAEREDEPDAE